MRSFRLIGAISCFALAVGCSSKSQISRAKALVEEGKPEEAIRLLDRKVPPSKDAKQDSEGLIVLGDALARLGHIADALEAYRKASVADPQSLIPVRKTAELLLATGNPGPALPLLETLEAQSPNDGDVIALRASALAGLQKTTEAEIAFRRALSVAPGNPDAAIGLAELLVQSDRDDEARQVLTRSASLSKTPAALLALGRLEEQSGNPTQAEQAYRDAVKRQDSPETNFRLAQHLQRASKIEEAAVILKHVDDLTREATAAADFDLQRGRGLAALRRYTESLVRLFDRQGESIEEQQLICRTIESALQQESNTPAQRVKNARLLLNQHHRRLNAGVVALLDAEIALFEGDLQKADSASSAAVLEMPNSPAARYVRGLVLERNGERALALQEWQRAADDGHVPSKLVVAQNALASRDFDVAEENAASVLRSEPANVEALLLYAEVLSEQGRVDASSAIVQRLLTVDPANAEAYVVQARNDLKRGQGALAILSYEKALIFDQRSQSAVDGLMQMFTGGKLTASSIARIEKMAEAPPQSATLFEIAGRLYESIGLRRDAARALQRSLELDAERPAARLALWHVAGATDSPAAIDSEHDLKADPSGVTANNLAFAYASCGQRLDRAFELAMQAVQQAPGRAEPMDTLGYVLYRMRQYSAASQAFERALEMKPDKNARRQINQHLADSYEASGLTDKAKQLRAAAASQGG